MGQGSGTGEQPMQVDACQAQHGAAAAVANGAGKGVCGCDDERDADAAFQAFVNSNGGKRKPAPALGRGKTGRKRCPEVVRPMPTVRVLLKQVVARIIGLGCRSRQCPCPIYW